MEPSIVRTRVLNCACGLIAAALLCAARGGDAQQGSRLNRAVEALLWRGELTSVEAALSVGSAILVIDGDQLRLLKSSGEGSVVVREGDGPLELRAPRRLFDFRGDSSLAAGKDESVLVVLSPSGSPVRQISVRELSIGKNWLRTLRGVSSDGKLLYVSPRLANPRVDSASLLVVDPARASVTSLGSLWYPPPGGVRDQVVLMSSGTLVVYRADTSSLEIHSPQGRRVQAIALPARARARYIGRTCAGGSWRARRADSRRLVVTKNGP